MKKYLFTLSIGCGIPGAKRSAEFTFDDDTDIDEVYAALEDWVEDCINCSATEITEE